MRPVGGATLIAVIVAAAVAAIGTGAGGAAETTDKCHYSGRQVVLKSKHVSVTTRRTSLGTQFYECHRPTGATDTLNDPEFGEVVFRPPAMAVSSSTLASANTATGGAQAEDDGTSVAVDRYFAEGEAGHSAGWDVLWAVPACIDPDENRFCRVARVVVWPNGSAAWTSCPERGCTRSATKAVFRFHNTSLAGRSDAQIERELLDSGRGIDAGSLRRKGGRVYWTKNGRRRSAAV